jgi:hypothetical protein
MPEKEKKSEFTVTDRRLFSDEGELRQDVVEAEERRQEREEEKREAQRRANEERAAERHSAEPAPPAATPQDVPEAPSAADQHASAEAYKQSTGEIDAEIRKELEKQGHSHRAQDFEMNFEKFLASLYMSSLMQLGMAAPQGGQPQVDLMGARQTIDIIGMLQEKTKGNLTPKEESILQNALYELRMAYIEVTNLIAQAPPPGRGGNGEKR